MVYAYKQVSAVVSTLSDMRRQSSVEFKRIFDDATKLGQDLHGEQFELSIPRITSRQVHCNNPSVSVPEDYFRITLYEYLSLVISELQDRFENNPSLSISLGLLYLLPSECIQLESEASLPTELAQAAEFYQDDLPHSVMLPTEYGMWIRKWKKHNRPADIPDKLVDVLRSCSASQTPNLHVLLQIALTLPITSCESERSFSQLKLIKNSRCSTMSDSRLTGLALMKINRDRCNNLTTAEKMTEFIKSFIQLHPRRMKLSFLLADQ